LTKTTVGLVVRIDDGKNIAGVLKSQLRELNLNNKYDAKFVKLDEQTISKLSRLSVFHIIPESSSLLAISNCLLLL
jgi:hypothetical protein